MEEQSQDKRAEIFKIRTLRHNSHSRSYPLKSIILVHS